MPKAMYTIWWHDTLGPMVGRSYPGDTRLTSEEAVTIFMGHGSDMQAEIGYTKIPKGLVISYMEQPNCIAVLLDKDDESSIVERNLQRVVSEIDFNSESWENEIKHAFERLEELIQESTGNELLSKPEVRQLIVDMGRNRVGPIKPKQSLKVLTHYPTAKDYLGSGHEEVERTLQDLEEEGLIVGKTFGRTIECQQCGSSQVELVLRCPDCGSASLHKVYTVFCPKCSNRFHTVVDDEISEVKCQKCKEAIPVGELQILDVEPLCNECGKVTNKPKIGLACAKCGKDFEITDFLGGTAVAYHLSEDIKTRTNEIDNK
ncbi:MAG: hypothetical protein KGY80_08175 [Candidatus Thorarchaeota archaeon]|nr:hypothetical protein [Candidatus Thorarchaeota archaeon]